MLVLSVEWMRELVSGVVATVCLPLARLKKGGGGLGSPEGEAHAVYRRPAAAAVLSMLAASALSIALAPSLMPQSYSWVRQVVSDTAAQGTSGAWLARLGFILAATAILLLSAVSGAAWSRWGRLMHGFYGLLLFVLATFSRRPWRGGSFDRVEDAVHNVGALIAGVTFTVAVLLVVTYRRSNRRLFRFIDWATVAAMLILPLAMLAAVSVAGLAQRLMVAIGLVWYAVEAMRVSSPQAELPILQGLTSHDEVHR